ncbi:MAG: hypothetical protein HY248_04245, partial [Fimbriimonas ginsengisoli]|nr:hypothetical protein [Fimbriimonas ginsengisoli]
MPRPIVYGNGRLLVALDARLRIRELFYPQVGQYDHLGGRAIRMGAWANGHFSWLDADDWTRTMAYETATLCGVLSAVDTRLGVSIEFQEGVLPDRPAFVRLMRVKNLTHLPLDVRLFFNHDLAIAESDTGQTALYHPEADALIHYKGSHAFLFGGRTESQHATSYHTAVKGYGGQDGSWQDAEDGVLDMNPICQGSIDSTLGLRLTLSLVQLDPTRSHQPAVPAWSEGELLGILAGERIPKAGLEGHA